jgi:flavin-dependent dehydrogenase
MSTWDVAVVGAGIAGSAAAALLAGQGLRVVLCEKGHFPRQKVCGEFLSPEGASVLQRLGVWPVLTGHSPPRIHGVALSTKGGVTRRELPVPGWGLSRWLLDQTLWDYAGRLGVTRYDRCPVRRIEGGWPQGFALTLPSQGHRPNMLKARAVLVASGQQWRFPDEPRGSGHAVQPRFVGLKTYVRGLHLGGQVELHAIHRGYCGLVEVAGDVSNLCCWVAVGDFRRMGGNAAEFLTSARRQNPALGARLQVAEPLAMPWYTTSIADRKAAVPVAEGRWHIGDRAAMVAPLTGDGMGMALRTAELAATHLVRAFRGELPWADAPATYALGWRREFLPRLRWGRLLEGILLQPRLASVARQMLHWMPSLMDLLYHRTRRVSPNLDVPSDGR